MLQGATPDSLTIHEALARARAHRPQALIASAAAERGRAALGLAGLIPNPSLQVEFDHDAPTRKAVVSQPLGWLLRRGADRAAGRALLEGGVADSVQQLADLSRDVRHAFYAALGARELERLIGEQAQIADSIGLGMQRRLGAGDVSIIEADQARQEAGRVWLMLSRAREDAASRTGRTLPGAGGG